MYRNNQLGLVCCSRTCPKYFKIFAKKRQIVSETSIKCNQAHLGMLLTNQITEFMKFQYLQNELRDKIDFLYVYISKEATI